MKTALIFGITGQDGSFLAELLLNKGYQVHGVVRRSSVNNRVRLTGIIDRIELHQGDITDALSVVRIILEVKPDEIYNLAAQSDVRASFDIPEYSGQVDALGTLRVLEAVRILGLQGKTRVYHASTSELFGNVDISPQNEETAFCPVSPYAIAKQYAYWMVREYRNAYGLFAVNGILFNHESERRGEEFVTRKITRAAARIAEGIQDKLMLGNLDSQRDWGYAKDYVECMYLMLQQDKPEDYIIATGETHSVREFTEAAFKYNGINIRWEGSGTEEKGIDARTGQVIIEIDSELFRPTEVIKLQGDPSKAIKDLGWDPKKTSYDELIRIMADHDRKLAKIEAQQRG